MCLCLTTRAIALTATGHALVEDAPENRKGRGMTDVNDVWKQGRWTLSATK